MIPLVVALIGAVALPAHVDPQVSEAPAGSRTTFSFAVEHGCEGSATTAVSIQVPEGAFDVVPLAPEGWEGSVDAAVPPVVTFTGGVLPDDVEGSFGVELVTPNLAGQEVFFPTVQTCEVGEIAWIDTAEDAEEPAPRIRLTENAQPILPTTTAPVVTTAPLSNATPTTTDSGGRGGGGSGDDDDATPTLLIGALALGAAVVVGVVASRRRLAGR